MVKMNLGLLLVLLWACSAIRAHRPRYGGSRRKAATQPQWFQMYSTGYKQCMILRYVTYVRLSFRGLRRVTTPKLFTSRCVRNSPNQSWGWTRNGQLQIKSNKRCLTLVPGRRYRSPTVTVQPCRGITTQQWTCNGHWLKSKSRNSYLVPIKYHGNRNGAVVIRSQATTSCKWVRYDSRRPLCKETAAPQPRWFQMYSTAYKQCMTLRYVTYIRFSRKGTRRFTRPTLKTYPCIRDNSKQLWQWASSGELKVKYNKRCLTLVTGKRFRSPTLTMQPCQKKNTQQWTCNGNWLKSKSSNNYLVPVRYYKNRYGAVVVRSRVTMSSKWVRRNSWRTLCDSGISTTLTPKTTSTTTQKTPLVRKSTTQPKTTAQTPPLPSTASPTPPAPGTPPVPPTDSFLTPPDPTFPGVTPPVPPTIKTTKPPPPPGNKNVKCGTKGRVGGVVNGTKSAAGSWPWQVGIRSCPDCNITCGGTLIKDDWVATAAHCVSDWFPHELYLVAGEIDQVVESGHEQEFRCDKIIVHEQYGHDAPYDKDIALVRLSKYAVFNDHVRPLCLPDTDSVLTDQDLCTVTGFGRVEQSGLKSARLLQANVKVVDQETCKKAYASLDPPRPVTKNMFCAGFEQGGTDACQGDSGGPLTCFDRRNAKFMLGGVVSWGVGCAQAKQYGVYTNVALFTSWIKEEIAKY